MRPDLAGQMSRDQLFRTLELWVEQGLKNVRFSGGEPTLHPGLAAAVEFCKEHGVENIAISTNGSADLETYKYLYYTGVNDFSISLDACCAQIGDLMAGRKGMWERVVKNIRELSKMTYVTIGMVFTEDNINEARESILFADSLSVSDIRIIPSAQYNRALTQLSFLPEEILNKYPILRYRINNVRMGKHVRGIGERNHDKCWLMLDDMAVAGDYHFPCIIYLREMGDPVGKVRPHMRQERLEFIKNHKPWEDPICKEMCLDVCVHYNTIASEAPRRAGGG
jgi:molybdenum cofactor biosynthesis enzyme MoaA